MTTRDIPSRIEELKAEIEEKEAELARKVNRRREISAKKTANLVAKQKFCARLKTETVQITQELTNLKTELWGLQEMQPAEIPEV